MPVPVLLLVFVLALVPVRRPVPLLLLILLLLIFLALLGFMMSGRAVDFLEGDADQHWFVVLRRPLRVQLDGSFTPRGPGFQTLIPAHLFHLVQPHRHLAASAAAARRPLPVLVMTTVVMPVVMTVMMPVRLIVRVGRRGEQRLLCRWEFQFRLLDRRA